MCLKPGVLTFPTMLSGRDRDHPADMEATVPFCSVPKNILMRVTWGSQVPYHSQT